MIFLRLLSLCLLLCIAAPAHALYVRTFGKPAHPAVIFLHGGPGYNSASFEATTAASLAAKGFYVVVYDRRGEGRSAGPAAFTFTETFKDLERLYDSLTIKKAVLIGHSFGGIVGTLFAEAQPSRVSALMLVSAPVSLQESFRSIRQGLRDRYTAKGDSANLKVVAALDKMDTASMLYANFHFIHAMRSGMYSTASPTEEAQAIYAKFRADSLSRLGTAMSPDAPQGFWKSERYTTLDLTANLQRLVAKGLPVYGLYGKEDGLYSAKQVEALADILGKGKLQYLDRCSHSVFIDRQREFMDAVDRAAGKR